MFEPIVVGMIPGQRLGVVQQCIACRTAAGAMARPCPGFGPGCLVTPSPAAWNPAAQAGAVR